MSDKSASIFAGVINNLQQDVISEKNAGLRILEQQVSNLTANLSNAQDELSKSKKDLEEARIDSEYYRSLLSKPLWEIAAKSGKFREAYEAQMELMADWMVSQKAFKEIAIQFGKEKGLTPQDIIDMSKAKKIDVLKSQFASTHGTNADGNDLIVEYAKRLETKFLSKANNK